MKNRVLFCLLFCIPFFLFGQTSNKSKNDYLNLNKPERLEWFRDLGFGMFIHFSLDSQLGLIISHSMVGASDDYLDRFVNDLPKTFNPKKYAPEEIAALAKLAGMKYIVFTAKHHSGFCMWDTQTTDFNITNTPYKKDLLSEYVKATRDAGLAVGLYYSPEDFSFLHKSGLEVQRRFPEPIAQPIMKKYLKLVENQCTELMTQYGDIDIIFFDGGTGALQEKSKKVVWEQQPDILVTRGAMKTPEQKVLGMSSNDPWESCITMGIQWAYKATHENYKSYKRLIEILIETRAKGGNLLLNVGPKPNGEVPEQQEGILREIAAWNFINHEAIENVSPWIVPNEGDIWFTWKPEEKTLYAFLTKSKEMQTGREIVVLKSARISKNTQVSVLGQSGKWDEYHPSTDPTTYFEQKGDDLHISCVRYLAHSQANPIVLKITNVSPVEK